MPNIRIWSADENGREVLLTTVVLDNKQNVVEVVHSAKLMDREAQRRINTDKATQALVQLALSDSTALQRIVEDSERTGGV